MEKETCPCMYCGTATPFTGTQKCNRCWELDWRIRDSPEIAVKVQRAMADEKKLRQPRRKPWLPVPK